MKMKKKKEKKFYTLEEVDKMMGWTKEELAEIKRGADEIIMRMNIKEARRKAGMTQEEVAKKAGMPRASISRIENGLRNVTMKNLQKIAGAMDMELEIKLRPASK